MKADYLSFQRATNRSLLGLAIQLALGLAMLLYGIFRREPAAETAAAFVLVGVPVWLTLAVLFDQHRRERIEAIEAEAFAASDAATSSVFEQQADDLKVASKRLQLMYKFLVPAVSIGAGALLIILGIWRFRKAKAALGVEFVPPTEHGWAIAVGVGAAFVGFLFARYVSGMAKQKVWANLRGGAAFAVGSALFGLALAIGHAVQLAGQDAVLRFLPVVSAAALVALGGEIFLNFLLDIYRPRKPGEYPRPAFESRVLGFVAAPDRIAESIGEAINYQFGYDVSSSWVYLLLSRTVFRVLLPVALVAMWAMSSMAVIRPHEKGLVLRFGRLSRVIEPGLNFKWPWPIERVEIPEFVRRDAQGRVEFRSHTVTGVRTLNIGSIPPAPDKPILWTNEHAAKEVFFLVQPGSRIGGGARPDGRGRDLSALAVEVPVQYAIEDVKAYEELAPAEMRDGLLKAVAQRAIMQHLSTMSVDQLLSAQWAKLQADLRAKVEEAFANLNPDAAGKPRGAGVKLLFVGVDGIHPPKDTAASFEQVVGAEQKYQARRKAAEGEKISTLTGAAGSVDLANKIVAELDKLGSLPGTIDGKPNPAVAEEQAVIRELLMQQAGGKASAIILEAKADRWQRNMEERARLFAYKGQLGTFKAAPAVYKASLYLDALRTAMANSRLYVIDADSKIHIRSNLEDKDTLSDVLRSATAEPNQ